MEYVLLNPGPVNLHPRVREAATNVDLCHRQQEFSDILISVKKKLKLAANTPESRVSILHGSGSLAVESGLRTFVSGRVLVINNGPYCQRIADSLNSMEDVKLDNICYKMGESPNLDFIEQLLHHKYYDWIAVVHHETATGILNPLSKICDMVEGEGTKVFVDAVSSFGAHKVDSRSDVICFNSNKCLESIPGAAIVIWNKKLHKSRAGIIPYLDVTRYSGCQIPCTPNTNAIMALNTAMDLFFEENRYERYAILSEHIRDVGSKYFELFLDCDYSNVLTSFKVDESHYEQIYYKAVDSGFIIYGGSILDQFRVCNLGVKVNKENINRLFDIIGNLHG